MTDATHTIAISSKTDLRVEEELLRRRKAAQTSGKPQVRLTKRQLVEELIEKGLKAS